MKKILATLTAVALLAALAVPALADTFVESIYEKDVPSTTGNAIVSHVDENDSWKVEEYLDDGAVTTLTMQECFLSKNDEIKNRMDDAYSPLAGGGDMFDYADELEFVMRNAGLIQEEADKENYVIRDMFYVQYDGELEPGISLKTTFVDMKLGQDDLLFVMVNVDDYWTVVPPQYVEITADGDVTVVLQDVGPIAFVVEKGE